MSIKKTSILFLFILFSFGVFGQSTNIWYYNCSDQVSQTSNFIDDSIRTVHICDLYSKNFPQKVKDFPNLKTIVVKGRDETELNYIIKQISKHKGVTKVVFDGVNITVFPKQITKLEHIKSLGIINNPNLDVKTIIDQLSSFSSLTELSLALNELSELPSNIGKLTSLKNLDISNNYLTDLPTEISKLDSLTVLNIEENIISNPINSLSKLESLNIKYLAYDKNGLTNEEMNRLFPDAEIKTKEVIDIIEPEPITKDTVILKDNIVSEKKIGTFTVKDQNIKAYSTAYLHYPKFFGSKTLSAKFDSTSFGERYLSYDYYNTFPRFYLTANNSFENGASTINESRVKTDGRRYISLGNRSKLFKPEIKFDLKGTKHTIASTNKLNPELNAFRGFEWIYKGNLSKKEFVNKYIKPSWYDIRIYYEDGGGAFEIELKDDSTHLSFSAYPIYVDKKRTIDQAQERYTTMYLNYQKALFTRGARFDKKLVKDKAKFKKQQQKLVDNTWKRFRAAHMSETENKLTREEWLQYYYNIIANERLAFYNADATSQNLIRGIELEGFERGLVKFNTIDPTLSGFQVNFVNEQNELVPVTSIVVINKTNNSYIAIEGSMGADPVNIVLSASQQYEFVCFLLNGDIGIADSQLLNSENNRPILKLEVVSRKLASIGQIYKRIGL